MILIQYKLGIYFIYKYLLHIKYKMNKILLDFKWNFIHFNRFHKIVVQYIDLSNAELSECAAIILSRSKCINKHTNIRFSQNISTRNQDFNIRHSYI